MEFVEHQDEWDYIDDDFYSCSSLTSHDSEESETSEELEQPEEKITAKIETEKQRLMSSIPKDIPTVIYDFFKGNKKHKKFEDLELRQQERRVNELFELMLWAENFLKMGPTISLEIGNTSKMNELTVDKALKLKDEILLSDWAYQKLRNEAKIFPSLVKIKEERKKMNSSVSKILEVTKRDGIIYANVFKVYDLLSLIHQTNYFKLTFDHRKNETRDEVLVAMYFDSRLL